MSILYVLINPIRFEFQKNSIPIHPRKIAQIVVLTFYIVLVELQITILCHYPIYHPKKLHKRLFLHYKDVM
jgi:hypothetical protein